MEDRHYIYIKSLLMFIISIHCIHYLKSTFYYGIWIMKIIKRGALTTIFILASISGANAESAASNKLKLGFGFDRDFGVAGAIGNINGFVGNKGVAVDYIFNKEAFKIEQSSAAWYIGAGGYGDWDGDIGARLPVGAELYFAKRWDAFAQLIPRVRINNDAKFGLDFGIGVRYQF